MQIAGILCTHTSFPLLLVFHLNVAGLVYLSFFLLLLFLGGVGWGVCLPVFVIWWAIY